FLVKDINLKLEKLYKIIENVLIIVGGNGGLERILICVSQASRATRPLLLSLRSDNFSLSILSLQMIGGEISKSFQSRSCIEEARVTHISIRESRRRRSSDDL